MAAGRPNVASSYKITWLWLALAALFPVALMVFNPTLMFKRGWEQYVGTTIYLSALVLLGRELRKYWRAETSFASAGKTLETYAAPTNQTATATDDGFLLTTRLSQLQVHLRTDQNTADHGITDIHQLLEINREASALDQEHAAGRFTIPRYILYLLPVIGFIGTVEGISKALMLISEVLPEVNNLDVFLSKLTLVTSALQIAFDSTLLALFLSASLMFVLTLVHRRAEDHLSRVDRFIVEQALPRWSKVSTNRTEVEPLEQVLTRVLSGSVVAELQTATRATRRQGARTAKLLHALGSGLAPQIQTLASALDRVAPAMDQFQSAARDIGQLESRIAELVQTVRLIEHQFRGQDQTHSTLAAIRQSVEHLAIQQQTLATTWAQAQERGNAAAREQMTRTLDRLKDALEMLQVSMEQGNTLYRTIVKKMFTDNASALAPTSAAGSAALLAASALRKPETGLDDPNLDAEGLSGAWSALSMGRGNGKGNGNGNGNGYHD